MGKGHEEKLTLKEGHGGALRLNLLANTCELAAISLLTLAEACPLPACRDLHSTSFKQGNSGQGGTPHHKNGSGPTGLKRHAGEAPPLSRH